MFYAEKDQNGHIVAIRKDPGSDGESVEVISEEELFDFLTSRNETDYYESLLRVTDTRVIRVLEDLIDVLISKQVIMLTDLPDGARQLIGTRKEARRRMQAFRLAEDDII